MVKNLRVNVGDPGDTGSIPGLGRSSGRGNGNPLHYSCLGNPMVREAWWAIDHGATKNRTRLKSLSMRSNMGHFLVEAFEDSALLVIIS